MAELQLDQLSPHNSEPLYVQIMRILEEQIRSAHLQPGDKLPTQQEMAQHFEVSLAPVKQALRELEKRGIVSSRQGRGTYVTDTTPLFQELIEKERIPCFTREMAESGRDASSMVLGVEQIGARQMPKAAQELQLGADDGLVFIERLRQANGNPLALQSSYLPASKLGGIVARGLGAKEALSRVIREEFDIVITASRQIITATTATPRDARYLNVPVDAPLLLVERTSFLGNGDPVEFVIGRRLPEFNFIVWLRGN